MKGLGFVFPGQGSQKQGMLSDLGMQFPVITETFKQASEVLGFDLWNLVQNDTKNELGKTSITQPAILSSSVAIWRLWKALGGASPALMAGHSLGEYSALVCSGVLDFQDAARLVQKRGELMQSAVPEGLGGMAAIVGLDDEKVMAACAQAAESQVVAAVNFNSPGQVVIAGHNDAVNRAIALCKSAGAKRALLLPVSAPFHCSLMKPAGEEFAQELHKVSFHPPEIPVVQNFGLKTPTDIAVIKENLIKQFYNPVPWVETVGLFAVRGITRILEIGPGRVLCGLIKRTQDQLEVAAVNDVPSLQGALESEKNQDIQS
ncbi:MAG: ACP S-malonyltransferase [Pseudomonadales bacterium]|nr:ACP S-malonyltransferase [Pseudomonadales bacterium]